MLVFGVVAIAWVVALTSTDLDTANPTKDITETDDNINATNNFVDNIGNFNTVNLQELPEYTGSIAIEINNNCPYFTDEEKASNTFEQYSELDDLGRCGIAFANISRELMPTEERGQIGNVKPSGWHTKNYHELIDGNYLYNRCHLIAFELTGENDNEKNLITGTRYFNVEGMLPFENKVASYVKKTGNHVLYRVTPVFRGDNLVASGINIEAWSVEDSGKGICFNVYIYNIQPGIGIDYSDGNSWILEDKV